MSGGDETKTNGRNTGVPWGPYSERSEQFEGGGSTF